MLRARASNCAPWFPSVVCVGPVSPVRFVCSCIDLSLISPPINHAKDGLACEECRQLPHDRALCYAIYRPWALPIARGKSTRDNILPMLLRPVRCIVLMLPAIFIGGCSDTITAEAPPSARTLARDYDRTL